MRQYEHKIKKPLPAAEAFPLTGSDHLFYAFSARSYLEVREPHLEPGTVDIIILVVLVHHFYHLFHQRVEKPITRSMGLDMVIALFLGGIGGVSKGVNAGAVVHPHGGFAPLQGLKAVSCNRLLLIPGP
jgi:hypothetical protein